MNPAICLALLLFSQMLRYIFKLSNKDISLTHSMIPLGSCTMKLNATAEMMPISWEAINRIHPFAPPEQTKGYAELIKSLEDMLCEITGRPLQCCRLKC